jgi:hypothetical protein
LFDLAVLLARKSLCLLGPRQSGKITRIRDAFPGEWSYDLLDGGAPCNDPCRT